MVSSRSTGLFRKLDSESRRSLTVANYFRVRDVAAGAHFGAVDSFVASADNLGPMKQRCAFSTLQFFHRGLRGMALFAVLFLFASCGNDPNPKPLREKRSDGSPWVVRYGGMPDEPR